MEKRATGRRTPPMRADGGEHGRSEPAPAVSIEAVLAPVDGSDESLRAVEYALAIAERYSARVHALYVLDRMTAREVAAGTADEATLAARSERFIATIRERVPTAVSLTTSTAYGFSPTRKTRHPGSTVLDAAEDAAVEFIVIPREPAGASGDTDTLSRAAEYVLQYADQPVLSV
jgi:nucleotide-binding universal stress UspA family protein